MITLTLATRRWASPTRDQVIASKPGLGAEKWVVSASLRRRRRMLALADRFRALTRAALTRFGAGGADLTAPTGPETALAVPMLFFALTTTASFARTSALVAVY